MWKTLRQLFKKQKNQTLIEEDYIHIPEKDFYLELKQMIFELESLGEAVSENCKISIQMILKLRVNKILASKFVET
ncbi:hypothetical protein [Bacillus halotolerans]|uniref:hypothetical protein n=1 Tax=Bacillus halotolerans TaxID=260554 RepID=UPI001ED8CC83|nr:hypothetical protein [Bacillus halotolerans]